MGLPDMGLLEIDSIISFLMLSIVRILVTRDIVDSGNNCNKRKKRIAPNMRSRPTVFMVGTFFSANHIIVALTTVNVNAPSPPPTQYRCDGVSVDIWTHNRKKNGNAGADLTAFPKIPTAKYLILVTSSTKIKYSLIGVT